MVTNGKLTRATLALDFVEPTWHLPVGASNWHRALLGWSVTPAPVDSGVPRPVAELLCATIVARGRVTFAKGLSQPGSVLGFRRTWREGREFEWVTTRDPKAAMALFDDEAFPWSMQAQAAHVVEDPGPASSLAPGDLGVPDERRIDDLARRGVCMLLLPGVDGDFAGIYARSDASRSAILEDLRTGVVRLGAEWVVTSEAGLRGGS
jgi:hypothetical protein